MSHQPLLLERPTEAIKHTENLGEQDIAAIAQVTPASKRLTIFIAADDKEIAPWEQETVIRSEWLEMPIHVDELGSMGKPDCDRWAVLEVVQFAEDRIVDLAITHPADLVEPARSEWLSIKYGEALFLYLDSEGEFVTAGIGPEEAPRIGEKLFGFPCSIKRFNRYHTIGKCSEHFSRLYLCVCG